MLKMKWLSLLSVALLGLAPTLVRADDSRPTIQPAVLRTSGDQPSAATVQTVGWRAGYGNVRRSGVYIGNRGLGVRFAPRNSGFRYYTRPRNYGAYTYPRYNYNSRGYTYSPYWYY